MTETRTYNSEVLKAELLAFTTDAAMAIGLEKALIIEEMKSLKKQCGKDVEDNNGLNTVTDIITYCNAKLNVSSITQDLVPVEPCPLPTDTKFYKRLLTYEHLHQRLPLFDG
eukprot:TRINITY_DN813_c0_g1_i1.p2 TRINITY_DN813_c0_g1~~TRINITY_DN813_c0_g1_i1.p2  ORF type:complete len:112 (-),score=15.69 TRINITY_DN813_c0_g1_i1:494-829(-)